MASKNTQQSSFRGNRVKTPITSLSPAAAAAAAIARTSVPVRPGPNVVTSVTTTKVTTTAKPVKG